MGALFARNGNMTRNQQHILYRVAAPADSEAIVHLLADVFPKHDPPAVAIGVTTPEFEEFVRLLLPQSEVDGLTLVAQQHGTGELAGVMLSLDSASPMPEALDRLPPKFLPVFEILGHLEDQYRKGSLPSPGESVHLYLLGVSSRFAGQGIAQRLVSESTATAARRGYRFAVTEATNRTSQHIFRKNNFVERVQGSYALNPVFASIVNHGGPILMDKAI